MSLDKAKPGSPVNCEVGTKALDKILLVLRLSDVVVERNCAERVSFPHKIVRLRSEGPYQRAEVPVIVALTGLEAQAKGPRFTPLAAKFEMRPDWGAKHLREPSLPFVQLHDARICPRMARFRETVFLCRCRRFGQRHKPRRRRREFSKALRSPPQWLNSNDHPFHRLQQTGPAALPFSGWLAKSCFRIPAAAIPSTYGYSHVLNFGNSHRFKSSRPIPGSSLFILQLLKPQGMFVPIKYRRGSGSDIA